MTGIEPVIFCYCYMTKNPYGERFGIFRPMDPYGERFGIHRRFVVLTYHYATFNHSARSADPFASGVGTFPSACPYGRKQGQRLSKEKPVPCSLLFIYYVYTTKFCKFNHR